MSGVGKLREGGHGGRKWRHCSVAWPGGEDI
jgi:hypothetical protein